MSERWPGLALAFLLGLGACDEPAPLVGPPRCEPQEELGVERSLKEGFRALAEGDRDAARARFELLLADEPGHPEALLGVRLASRPEAFVRPSPKAPAAPRGTVRLAGALVPVDVPIVGERLSFEERRAEREIARAKGLESDATPLLASFRPRTDASGAEVAHDDRAAVVDLVDLIVLHDTHTTTARESFVTLGAGSGSTHFFIDWDGTIYQALDLGWEANHVEMGPIDRRSISIDLVNPVELTAAPPLPPTAAARGVERPLSDFVRIQGEEVQAWGYTEPQLESLVRLVRALVTLFPRLPAQVPRDLAQGGEAVPRHVLGPGASPVGIVGHLHLFSRASDPGPGFPWERFGDALR